MLRVQCDLVRPSCGRCRTRGLACAGLPVDDRFIFFDENQRAQRNSQRARRERQPFNRPVSFELALAPTTPTIPTTQTSTLDFRDLYPWLHDYSQSRIRSNLAQDLDTRAIDRFFTAWTLFLAMMACPQAICTSCPRCFFRLRETRSPGTLSMPWLSPR